MFVKLDDLEINKRLNVYNRLMPLGCTVKEMALELNISVASMGKFLRLRKLKTINSQNCKADGSFISIESRHAIEKEELFDLYINKKLSSFQIAKIKHCSKVAILNHLKRFGIPTRTASESQLNSYKTYRGKKGFSVGDKNPAWGKSNNGSESRGHHVVYKGITFKSSYEAKFAEWCDSKNLKWEYEPKRFNLFNELTYTPDFLVNGEWIEIKGWMTERGKRSIELFRKSGLSLKVFMKEDLISMGVLK